MKNRYLVDHTGNIFKSTNAMCEHWGVRADVYYSRYRNLINRSIPHNKALRQALTGEGIGPKTTERLVLGLDGETYTSVSKVAKEYKLNYNNIYKRLRRNNWILTRDMLEGPVEVKKKTDSMVEKFRKHEKQKIEKCENLLFRKAWN